MCFSLQRITLTHSVWPHWCEPQITKCYILQLCVCACVHMCGLGLYPEVLGGYSRLCTQSKITTGRLSGAYRMADIEPRLTVWKENAHPLYYHSGPTLCNLESFVQSPALREVPFPRLLVAVMKIFEIRCLNYLNYYF